MCCKSQNTADKTADSFTMASLYQRGSRYYAQFYVLGKRYQFALKTSRKRTAQQLLKRLERAYEERSWDRWRMWSGTSLPAARLCSQNRLQCTRGSALTKI